VNTAATLVAPAALDEVDQRIIDLLREDGRLPFRAIARALGLTEATVRSRVRRLEDSRAMRVVAVTDTEAAGYHLLLSVGVQVEHHSPEQVARELATLPEVFSLSVVLGSHDIEALVVARDQEALHALLYQRMAQVPGVRRLTPSLAVNVLKNQPHWVPL
jgi:Lrp/AsnC family transcriptional regulator, regulator for asnA, asnC and gidA